MDDRRTLLLAPDPVAAWRALGWGPGRGRVVVASPRAAAAFGLHGGWTTLARLACAPPTVVATPLARRRALRSAVLAEALGPSDAAAGRAPRASRGRAAEHADARADAAGYAAVAGPAVRELLRAADLDAPPPALEARLARWWRVARRYRDALAQAGTVDPAHAVRRAAAHARASGAPGVPLAVVGHQDLEADEVALIDALAGPGSVVVLPHDPPWTDAQRAARAALRERGWRERLAEGERPSAALVAQAPATREAEARWAVAEAKRLRAAGVPAHEVLLATRDVDAAADALATAAAAAGLPLAIERRRPLAATAAAAPVVAWLEAVAQEGAFEATLAWLAHPRVARLSADEAARVRRTRPSTVSAWRRFDPDAAAALGWPRRAPAAHWRTRLADGWAGFGVVPRVDPVTLEPRVTPETAPLFAPEAAAHDDDPFHAPALAEAWADGLASLDELADAGGRVPRSTVVGALRDALRAATVADDDPDAADPLRLVPLEAVGDARARHVLILGAVDGSLPYATPDDPVLGFAERAALSEAGVPLRSAGDLARVEALRFWAAWRAAGERLWLGVPAQTGADARLPSPYLARLGVVPRAVGEPPPASPAAFRARALRAAAAAPDALDPVLAHARRAHAQALAREVDPRWGPDDGYPGLPVDPDARGWSATQLTQLGTCRFRWWVERIWGVAAPEEGPTDLTPLLEGRLYHAALEHALRAARGLAGADARAAAEGALEAAFVRAERAEGIAGVVPHWARRRDDHLAHLRGLVRAEAFLPEGHEVLDTEIRFAGSWHGWRVQGRVDRVDRTPAGLRLIDYKLGGDRGPGARDAELAPTLDLQLPLYEQVAAPAHYPGERVAGAVYLSLRKMDEVRATSPDPADLDDLFGRLRASLRAGFFPVEPHEAVCRRCDLELVCRKGPHLELKPPPFRVPGADAGGGDLGPGADGSAGERGREP